MNQRQFRQPTRPQHARSGGAFGTGNGYPSAASPCAPTLSIALLDASVGFVQRFLNEGRIINEPTHDARRNSTVSFNSVVLVYACIVLDSFRQWLIHRVVSFS